MDIVITETITTANIAGTSTTVTLTYPGIQGAPGSDGIVTVNAPLTNTGTMSSAVLGIDQTALSLAKAQIVGTAVTLADTGTVTNAMLAGSIVASKIVGTAVTTVAGKATTAGTADYATLAGSATNAGTSVYATNAGTSVYALTAATAITTYATNAGTSVYATNAGTSVYATNAGTAVNISGTITATQTTGTAATLGTANVFITGDQIIKTGADATSGLNIWRNSATQTGALFTLFTSTGTTTLAKFDAKGALTLSPDAGVAATVNGVSGAVSLIVKGASGNSSNLQEWQTSAATVATVSSAGAFTISPSSGTALTVNGAASVATLVVKGVSGQNIQEWWISGASSATSYVGSDGAVFAPYIRNAGANGPYLNFSSTQMTVRPSTATKIGLAFQAESNQTANLTTWTDSSGTVLGGRNASGHTFAGTTQPVVGVVTTALTSAAYTSATVAVFTYGGTSLVQVGQYVTVAGVAGGAYNGTWQVTAVTSTTFTVAGSGFTNNAGTGGTFALSAVASFVAPTAAITPLIVKGASGQTARAFSVQSSGGTENAYITAGGTIMGGAGNIQMASENSGGELYMKRQTAAASFPGANNAYLYFRDGTNAGTLKLVVRAGTAGAETTILDNIPTT